MTTINFSGVELPENTTSTFKSVKAGKHTLTVASIEEVTSQGGTPGLQVTFDSKEAEASFRETFWLSPKALSRVVYLLKEFAGFTPEGNISTQEIISKLVGKSRENVVVDADLVTKVKGDKTYVNQIPKLRFMGFVDPQGSAAEPIINDKTAELSPSTTSKATNDNSDDLPF